MNSFTWLVIGHLVGDWMLQSDWMAQGKRQALVTAAGMTHFLVYTLATLGALIIFHGGAVSAQTYALVAAIIFVTHWLIDATDIVDIWMKLYKQSNIPMLRIMVDQTFHFLVLAAVTLLLA